MVFMKESKILNKRILCVLTGSLITIFIISIFNLFTSYDKNLHAMLPTLVIYKHQSEMTHLSSDVIGYLTTAKKRTLYFGKLPSQENAITINSPERATLYIYPLGDNSIIIKYEPRHGINRVYKNSGFGNFNSLLKAFYELTENEVFNETVVF